MIKLFKKKKKVLLSEDSRHYPKFCLQKNENMTPEKAHTILIPKTKNNQLESPIFIFVFANFQTQSHLLRPTPTSDNHHHYPTHAGHSPYVSFSPTATGMSTFLSNFVSFTFLSLSYSMALVAEFLL